MISIENIEKEYNGKLVLKNINAFIQSGTVFALLGPNGSGKTTLIKTILGLTYPNSGYVKINGVNLDEYKSKDNAYIGYMPQMPQFPLNLKVKEIIGFLTDIGGSETVHLNQLMDELNIHYFWDQFFGKLSLGMRQKVNILQCFMCDLDIYIIDEPTASLDPGMAFYLKNLIEAKKNAGKTILFTSHIMSEVESLAEEMLVLVDGEAVASGNPADFKQEMNAGSLEEAMITFWNKK